MPPGPAYNWFCVLYSASQILSNAATYRAAQVAQLVPRNAGAAYVNRERTRTDDVEEPADVKTYPSTAASGETVNESVKVVEAEDKGVAMNYNAPIEHYIPQDVAVPKDVDEPTHVSLTSFQGSVVPNTPTVEDSPLPTKRVFNSGISGDVVQPPVTEQQVVPPTVTYQPTPRSLQSSKVPSSRLGRLFHYGGLAASIGYGAASELIRRTASGSDEAQPQTSVIMTESNIKRLVSKLSQMRGAALKLGQFMSIQDTHLLPPEIDKIFRRVQDSAHYMPDWQMEKAMEKALGPSWSSNFVEFDRIPFAAASIGQVHMATLAAEVSPSGKAEPVAVKIQFPNISNSIDSDLGYIRILLTAGKLLPRGLFLDKTIQAMKDELADECDYKREASFMRTFGTPEYLGNDPRFKVPWAWEGSTNTVLVMERVNGVSVGEANAMQLSQSDRNQIAAGIVELCLKELFEFRAMQTDPNWTNFLWNSETRQIELVDFGATREYTKEFMDNWLRLLQAAASADRDACVEWSLKLGYLTGKEDEVMLNAHVDSMLLTATPFRDSTPQPFSFGPGTKWAEITSEIREHIPVMLHHRLTPPPRETYSLNRKLSGAFLLASRLQATIDTKAIWDKITDRYQFNSAS
ncbi:ABC1 family-domain-containing protein [Cyathus striatus]|nr:ABC1 family-domain-containing protein [Cyathus striatus]